jgi:hypothetical protein
MECKIHLCYIEDEDYDGRDYHERMLNSICDGIWDMDICLSREDVEKLGVMLIKMAHTRDTRGCGDY